MRTDAVRVALCEYSMTTFNDFGLHSDINRALAAKDYTVPTPIQVQAIPPPMKGRDLCGIAQTGTGKTAGFDRKTTRLNSSHQSASRMPSSACKKKNENKQQQGMLSFA